MLHRNLLVSIVGFVLLASVATAQSALRPAALPKASPTAPSAPASLHLVDLTGDGQPDRLQVAADGSLAVSVHAGGRTYAPVVQALPRVRLTALVELDANGDGLTDLYLVSSEANRLLLGDGTGVLHDDGGRLGLADRGHGISAELRDLDADGLADVILHNVSGDVVFWAEPGGGFVRDADTPEVVADQAAATTLATLVRLAAGGAVDPASLGDDTVVRVGLDERGQPEVVLAPRPAGLAQNGLPGDDGDIHTATTGPTLTGVRAGAQGSLPPNTYPQVLVNLLSPFFVNDDADEVDSADIADGSLTGADVSTSGGDVTFPGAVLTATQGVFGTGVSVTELNATVSGGESNAASSGWATVSGGWSNTASGTLATVSGGRDNWGADLYATVSGGYANTASDPNSTVSGGYENTASGLSSTVSGGRFNQASGSSSSVGGGQTNQADGVFSAVGGGAANVATGVAATIPGGGSNQATASYSFAAGRRAVALHQGAFVWSDSSTSTFESTADDQFLVEAAGGMGVNTNTPPAGGLDVAGIIESSGASGGEVIARNPNNANASVKLSWLDDVARLRVGGSGAGGTNGFDIQTTGDASLLRLQHDGKLGVGTTSPDAGLHVVVGSDVSPSDGGFLQLGSSTGTNVAIDTNEIMARNNGATASLTLQADGGDLDICPNGPGQVGIGTGSPSARLHVAGDSSSEALRVAVDGTTRFKVTSDGTVAVGSNITPSFDLQISGSAPNGGTAGKPGGGSWSVSSDRRLKTNVADLEGSLDTLLALRGVTYEYIDPAAIGELEGVRTGFIAQEVETVLPDWVDERSDGMKMLTIRGFEALAVEALRELAAQNAELQARVAELEAQTAAE